MDTEIQITEEMVKAGLDVFWGEYDPYTEGMYDTEIKDVYPDALRASLKLFLENLKKIP